jgi:iron complex transport system ATP-binding protein
MIQLQQVYFKIGTKVILQDISAHLLSGQLTVLLGSNGAGKSTLLKLLAGDTKPSSGGLTINQQPLHHFSAKELAKCRAVLTQQYAISLPFSAKDVVMMGRYPYFTQSPSLEDEYIVQSCMQHMMVEGLSSRWFHTLSGGEQQRIQMARVLAQLYPLSDCDKKILLLDEPTSSMDCLHQQLSLQKAKELALAGCTVVVVLHDLNLAAQFADQILLLKNGKLLASGNTSEVFQTELIQRAYDFQVDILHHPEYQYPIVLPSPLYNRHKMSTKKIA